MPTYILEIAVATPLRQSFDYLPPPACDCSSLLPGTRLEVPLGRRKIVGILLAVKSVSSIDPKALKAAIAVLDTAPALDSALLKLCRWSADYYLYPLGEALFSALPPALRKVKGRMEAGIPGWRLSGNGLGLGVDAFRRAPRRQQLFEHLLAQGELLDSQVTQLGFSRQALRDLIKGGWVEGFTASPTDPTGNASRVAGPELNPEQHAAVAAIVQGLDRFHPCLLQGVTGSGKTEVYLQAIAAVVARGRQALVLVPEIGLTPQTIARFEQRFPGRVVAMHSGLAEGERLHAWRAASQGHAMVVIGTRSAIFARFRSLGLVVIDEEHDTSYKQQEGFRFSARDVAVKRAQLEAIPVVLGSATPSAESLHNALQGRYQSVALHQRAGSASAPQYQLLDLRGQTLEQGFCQELLHAIGRVIAQGNQVLVFLNRRGFAPALLCHDCGWVANCAHCDARMVVHRRSRMLKCHHCDAQAILPVACPQCHGQQLAGVGQGTERSEDFLKTRFKSTPVLRVDRDTTRRKGAMDDFVARIHSGEPAILVGTQMLAKGHHFPRVTLVAVLDADAGMCSTDFRGPERTAQMLMQVAGRAGRAERAGIVQIQTHQPEHPLLQLLVQDRYQPMMEQILVERRLLQLPPFGYLGIIRAEASEPGLADELLLALRQNIEPGAGETAFIGPLPPPIARRAGRFRSQLLLKHTRRGLLHQVLDRAVSWLQQRVKSRKLRWSVDVDPQDFI